jgi:hypothetical protein
VAAKENPAPCEGRIQVTLKKLSSTNRHLQNARKLYRASLRLPWATFQIVAVLAFDEAKSAATNDVVSRRPNTLTPRR